jgi:hypothetical protein
MKKQFKILSIFILTIFLFDAPGSGFAQSLPVVRVQPATLEVDSEEVFTLQVSVENVVELYGFDILLEFDPILIQITGVEMGEFLEQGLYFDNIDNSSGSVQIVNSQVNPEDPQSGSGILALIHFVALTKAGVSPIDFPVSDDFVALSDEEGNQIECNLVNGSVEVIGSGEKEEYLVFIPLIMR